MFFYEKLDPFKLKDCDMKFSDEELWYLLDLSFSPPSAVESPVKMRLEEEWKDVTVKEFKL